MGTGRQIGNLLEEKRVVQIIDLMSDGKTNFGAFVLRGEWSPRRTLIASSKCLLHPPSSEKRKRKALPSLSVGLEVLVNSAWHPLLTHNVKRSPRNGFQTKAHMK